MRRWEYARANNILTKEEKEMLKVPGNEHTLFINEEGNYELIPYFQQKEVCGGNTDVFAFTLERENRSYALIWHNTGSAKVSIPIANCDAKYVSDLTREALPIEEKDGKITINVCESAYLSTNLSVEELREALKKATIV